MRSTRIIVLAAVILITAFVIGCSSGSITEPTIDLDRALDGGGPGGGNGPHGPWGPWGDFEVDCVSLFDVDYVITLPSDNEKEASGRIKIFDSNCDADESDVLVKFMFFLGKNACKGPSRILPGTKTVTDDGILYAAEFVKEKEWKHHGFEFSLEYELLVTEEVGDNGTVNVIEGWLERRFYHYWEPPNGESKEKERIWYFDITGEEIEPDDG